MSRIHSLFYATIDGFAKISKRSALPSSPKKIFCLRNNNLGDVIVITPIFEALRKRYPDAEIVAGVGHWAVDVLKHNPFVDKVVEINGPWHNRFATKNIFFASRKGILRTIRYILFSEEAAELAREHCDIGIDILGSYEGAAFLMRTRIPYRLGVKGYSGGDRTTQGYIDFRPREYVGRFALRFVQLLGLPEADLPNVKPQLYLTAEELEAASRVVPTSVRQRIVVSFGTGDDNEGRAWPTESLSEVLARLNRSEGWDIVLIGSADDATKARDLSSDLVRVINLCGKTTLRETFAIVATASAVLCSPSMLMHVAAAFERKTVVPLGPGYTSATAEAATWNCSSRTSVLGREPGLDRLATADEVYSLLVAP